MAEGSWIRIGAVDAHLNARVINPIIKEALGKKAVSITQMPDLRKKIGEALVETVTPLVPMRPNSGVLRDSGRATDDGRVYWTAVNERGENYAGYVYDQDATRWSDPPSEYLKPTTDHTYPRWVERVQPRTPGYSTPEYDAFLNNARVAIIDTFRRELDE